MPVELVAVVVVVVVVVVTVNEQDQYFAISLASTGKLWQQRDDLKFASSGALTKLGSPFDGQV